ncbi:hypothetical protein F2Q68_00039859 [Brassica cretica]|uniref:Uncharacterized protein n=1 Tax=Brassica cretica TaxID=69181 RepID=A0A8S9MJ15_BRACR|nr:hypothetical protein F2Q68_00039859 [Brassica cretica]
MLGMFWGGLVFPHLVPSGFKETPYSLDREDSDERGHVLWLSITRRCNVAVTRRTVDCRAVTRRTVGSGRLKVPSFGLCGCKALSHELAGRVSGLNGLGCGVNFVTLTRLSLARLIALPDHGVGLDGQSCSCLIVGWPVSLSSPTLSVGRLSVMFLFNCWPVGRPMPRTVRGCYRGAQGLNVTMEKVLTIANQKEKHHDLQTNE